MTNNIIVKGKDLKPGDCIKGNISGIVISINGLNNIYGDEDHYEIYDINYCHDGTCSSHLDMDDNFELILDRKEILRYYNKVELELLRQSADCMKYRNELVDIRSKVISKLNKKLSQQYLNK